MPATLAIHPCYGLMYVAFSGHVKASEGVAAFESYIAHPQYSPGQKHLIDFSVATSFAGDFTQLMTLQARLVDAVMPNQQTLFVFCAPTQIAQELTQYSVIAWRNIKKVVVRVLKSEAEAMDVVGLPGMTFVQLREKTT